MKHKKNAQCKSEYRKSKGKYKKILNIIYMDSICEEINDDMHKIEEVCQQLALKWATSQ